MSAGGRRFRRAARGEAIRAVGRQPFFMHSLVQAW
jgi:hypothetical protein